MKALIKAAEHVDKLAIPVVAAFGFLLVYSLMNGSFSAPPPDDAWFKSRVIDQQCPVVVKFGADWCGPCRQMDPILTKYAGSTGGAVRVVRVNVDERRELANHYSVRGIPKIMIFKQGKAVASITGSRSYQDFASWVDGYR